jgi:hypothetical protein
MKFISKIVFCFAVIGLVSCNNEVSKLPVGEQDQITNGCDSIYVGEDIYNSSPEDPLSIEKVDIEENCLKISVAYGGGCGDVEFKLVCNGMMLHTYPPQLGLKLSFKDDDHCKALIHKTLSYDLTKVKAADKMTFHLKGWSQPIDHTF